VAKAKNKAKNKMKPKSKVKAAPKKAAAKKATAKKLAAKKTAAKKTAPVKKVLKKAIKSVQKVLSTKPTSKKSSSIHLIPLADRVVVRVDGPSEKTAGGLYIPGTVNERPNQGKVLACGPGGKSKKGHLKPLDVKKGDTVLFNRHAGVNTEIDGEELLILRESELLGVIS
jgi:chaperonin GroES